MRNEIDVARDQLNRGNEVVIIFGKKPGRPTGREYLPLYCKNLSLASRTVRDDFPDEKNWTIMKTAEFIEREGRIK